MHRYLALDTLFEGDKRLCGHHSRNTLKLVVEKVHQLLVVLGIQFYQHGVRTGGEMTLHYLRDMHESLHHLFIHTALFERDAHVCTSGISQALGIDIKSTSHDDISLYEMLHSLVDGGTRHIALSRYILEWDTCILRQNVQYLFVKIINFFYYVIML